MPALSDLRRKKLIRLFGMMDGDRNGYIELGDFERMGDHFPAVNGFAPGSPEFEGMRAQNRGEWTKLEAAADSDGDGRVGVEEYLTYYAAMQDLSEVTNKTAGMILAMLDRDRDGKVSRAEYVASAPPGVPETAQAALFARLDRDRDGYLTTQEVLQAVQEFMLGEDPGAPGNDLLGPLG